MTRSTAPRVALIDDDEISLLVAEAHLSRAGFDVHRFQDARAALAQLDRLRPALIVCDLRMPELDGRQLLRLAATSPALKDTPFLFLSSVAEEGEIVGALEGGAHDYLVKPVSADLLAARVRAALRTAERLADARRDAVVGPIGPAGLLPVVKFCEDRRLTGRLVVEDPAGVRAWLEFLGGELVASAGGAGEDGLDRVLAIRTGSYSVQQRPLDTAELQAIAAAPPRSTAAADPGPGGAPIPGGRLSRLILGGDPIEIQTEAENRPNFTATTVVVRGGRVVRRIESAWQHSYARRADEALARAFVDAQHERVTASLRDLARRKRDAAAGTEAGVEAGVLASAVCFVSEHVQERLGLAMTLAALRRSRDEVHAAHPQLAAFHVLPSGRVVLEERVQRLSPEAPAAVAAWVAAFVAAAATAEPLFTAAVRETTAVLEPDLQRCGFYAALDALGGAERSDA